MDHRKEERGYLYLAYCNLIWASIYATRRHRLITLRKRAIRLVAGTTYVAQSPLFRYLILKIRSNYAISKGWIYLPLYIHAYKVSLNLTSEVHSHSTRNSKNYRNIFACTNTRLLSIKVIGASIWNGIRQAIWQPPSQQLFKSKLYTFIYLKMVEESPRTSINEFDSTVSLLSTRPIICTLAVIIDKVLYASFFNVDQGGRQTLNNHASLSDAGKFHTIKNFHQTFRSCINHMTSNISC